MQKWLSVVGIGEDGLSGLSSIALSLLDRSKIVVGGARHLAMLPTDDTREKLVWASPLQTTVDSIISRRGESVCVLASGDPMCHGIGVTLSRRIPIAEMTVIPAASAFSLACARLGWALADVETFSLTNRPIASIALSLYPGARLLVLSADRHTPEKVAQLLAQRGFGSSLMTVFERMGGDAERRIEGVAAAWNAADLADLNAIAIAVAADRETLLLSRTAGLPDAAYRHDGLLTKREVRAVTLSALAPIPGELLWDVGAGCGSIAIEWMRSHRSCRAIAIERHPTRLEYIAENASNLGVPELKIVAGDAPEALANLPQPDAIFIGGGVTAEGLLEACWNALGEGGRLVVNAVTVESELKVLQWHSLHGGELIRIGIQRVGAIGSFLGWKPLAPITQWAVVKG
ncbi:MAG: precorrin-6y C5,15-methyltransferase (decarboxylating) subunit CbiE [Microcoleus sp. PH2017_10_PVI_O_A]|uniref:precorrin-6y C5,15-methyltransferase (decarboxylating) subunit CbiE n=1 Tax=unclassified Microcoleus TaxID=2642155 RepID=UPI001D90B322|nr:MULTISPECIES: precorrin-6y C5,15-methyltransferase (decarboxylating) subunit CbiE [unclassified Microcoleus]TAE79377.1 MAG: precorrin-6y C5,15-methyltransferase (decarboxylating) subunit CbiE [Oscillatoriales cyanobacterium]MCC3408375.1 precorrin-6y C5,15-methyltransferase (decarboxylating) subunit CbiE [Microcoleus sp. PH2017_10_PVI_O_A]MCC3462434.1 precorrin-6y C5,15-methyltransferase (decarboxylating) subunit CbiE [Microcoleus sp. PH2017_11_PCY_U_A]MCC3480332.1 precorrin-6y C5,15-methyltr